MEWLPESIIVGKMRSILLHGVDARQGKLEVTVEDLLCRVLNFLQVHGLGFSGSNPPPTPQLHGISIHLPRVKSNCK